MKHAVCVAVSALCLAACNKGPEVHEKDASVAEVAQKVREAGADQSFVHPGLWQSKVTIDSLDMPGMPAEMAARMKTMMAQNQPHDFQTCLTAEDVKRPKEDFFAGKNKECRYDHFTMGGGKIDIQMVCSEEGATQTTNMAGTYTPTSYSMDMSSKGTGGGMQNGMTMKMHVDSHRIGECTGKEG